MKIGTIPRKETPTKHAALLPLELDESEPSGKIVTHVLRVTPNDDQSKTYKTNVLVLTGAEDVRTIIGHPKEVKRILTGLNATTIQEKITISRTLLDGNALTQFNQQIDLVCQFRMGQRITNAATEAERAAIRTAGIHANENYHADDINVYLNGMVLKLVPAKALAKVKRHLRRHCRKPAEMTIRQYYQNLFRINQQEIPCLPPFEPAQSFRDDEFIDILLFGTPQSWAREMDRQGFDPMMKTPEDVVAFMEQIEATEAFEKTSTKAEDKKKAAKKKAPSNKGTKKELKYCEVHGECGHSTDECRVAKRSKNGNGNQKGKGNFGNKEWKRKSDEDTSNSKKELALLIKKTIKKELASVDKKRKSKDDDDDIDGFLAESLDGALSGFDYDEMDSISV